MLSTGDKVRVTYPLLNDFGREGIICQFSRGRCEVVFANTDGKEAGWFSDVYLDLVEYDYEKAVEVLGEDYFA